MFELRWTLFILNAMEVQMLYAHDVQLHFVEGHPHVGILRLFVVTQGVERLRQVVRVGLYSASVLS